MKKKLLLSLPFAIVLVFAAWGLVRAAGTGQKYFMDSAQVESTVDIRASSIPSGVATGMVRTYVDSTTNALAYSTPGLGANVFSNYYHNRNKIMNGDFKVWQRGTSFGPITTPTYTADRWNIVSSVPNSGTYTITQVAATGVPGSSTQANRMTSALNIVCSVINGGVLSATVLVIRQTIEGNEIPNTWITGNSGNITLSFWAKSHQTGAYGIALQNGAGTARGAMTTFTINQADTWQYVVQTFGGLTAPNTNTSAGLELDIALVAGAGEQGTASTNFTTLLPSIYSTSSQVNFGSSTSNTFSITGVQLEEGSQANQFETIPYQQELALCQRYYQKSFEYGTAPAHGVAQNTGEYIFNATIAAASTERSPAILYMVPLRIVATPNIWGVSPNASAQLYDETQSVTCTGSTVDATGTKMFMVHATGGAGTIVGSRLAFHWDVNADF